MESETMRLDLEDFINTALDRDRPGWPVKTRNYNPPTSSTIAEPTARETDLRWLQQNPIRN